VKIQNITNVPCQFYYVILQQDNNSWEYVSIFMYSNNSNRKWAVIL